MTHGSQEPAHKAGSDSPAAASHTAPGVRLGLPDDGPGSVAGWGRRIAALLIDWALANFIALVIAGSEAFSGSARWLPLAVWFVVVWLLTGLTGASAGQRLLRITVLRLDHRPVGLVRAFVRTALIALVVPPLVFDRDGRGLHDMAAGTVVVRGPR